MEVRDDCELLVVGSGASALATESGGGLSR